MQTAAVRRPRPLRPGHQSKTPESGEHPSQEDKPGAAWSTAQPAPGPGPRPGSHQPFPDSLRLQEAPSPHDQSPAKPLSGPPPPGLEQGPALRLCLRSQAGRPEAPQERRLGNRVSPALSLQAAGYRAAVAWTHCTSLSEPHARTEGPRPRQSAWPAGDQQAEGRADPEPPLQPGTWAQGSGLGRRAFSQRLAPATPRTGEGRQPSTPPDALRPLPSPAQPAPQHQRPADGAPTLPRGLS